MEICYSGPDACRGGGSFDEYAVHPVEIAVIVTPGEAAQPVTDRCVALGVKAILNFAPVQLVVPDDVMVKTVNLALELETLSFALANR